ncbi:SGNH/GDSL hydrolase family protein [Janibacter sp. GXQ6167]|uniref:SGNH/GDSL hydrolase family protein n=1 Tax=Janibacter sp. GXQ6167 TaxID=3240791 RepID=UPI003524587F
MAGLFVAIGDSFTEGVGDPNLHYPNGVRGWADRMARQLGRADPHWRYANLAIRSKFLGQVVADQIEPALALSPTHISFYAGGNDLLTFRTDLPSLLRRYDEALQRLVASGAHVLAFTAFDTRASPLLEPLRRRVLAFNNGVREIAAARGAHLLDHTLMREYEDPALWSRDRIHMSRYGHKRMAAHVLTALEIPHTLQLRDLVPHEPRGLRHAARAEAKFVRTEMLPLVKRRLTGVYEGDTLRPKWPEPIHPADGMKRLARDRADEAPPFAGFMPPGQPLPR